MKIYDKRSLKRLEGTKVPKPALKYVVGGCDTIDGGDLGEVVVSCGQYSGQCWKCHEFGHGECRFHTGMMNNYCDAEIKCSDMGLDF